MGNLRLINGHYIYISSAFSIAMVDYQRENIRKSLAECNRVMFLKISVFVLVIFANAALPIILHASKI